MNVRVRIMWECKKSYAIFLSGPLSLYAASLWFAKSWFCSSDVKENSESVSLNKPYNCKAAKTNYFGGVEGQGTPQAHTNTTSSE